MDEGRNNHGGGDAKDTSRAERGVREPSKGKEIFRGASDPELAGALAAKGAGATGGSVDRPTQRAMSVQGWFGAPFPFAVGLTSLGAAAALAAVHAQQRARAGSDESLLREVGVVIIWGVVGTVIGFVALKCVAAWWKRPVGDARLAAVRMFAATGLFMLVANMGIAPTGWSMLDRPAALGLATLAYLAVVWASFRLTREVAMAVLFAHALAWLGVYGASRLAPRLWREGGSVSAPATDAPFEPPHAPAAPGAPVSKPPEVPQSPTSEPSSPSPTGDGIEKS